MILLVLKKGRKGTVKNVITKCCVPLADKMRDQDKKLLERLNALVDELEKLDAIEDFERSMEILNEINYILDKIGTK